MITMETDRLVDDYLGRLEKAAAHMQRSRRAELIAEIREHIETALREEEAASEVAVRNVLERLGPPEEIVEAAEPEPATAPARPGTLEIAALVALIVPFVGWLVGIVLVLVSNAWSNRDKAVGIALALLPALFPLGFVVFGSGGNTGEPLGGPIEPAPASPDVTVDTTSSEDSGVLEVLVIVVIFLAGLPSAIYLGLRLRRHKGREVSV